MTDNLETEIEFFGKEVTINQITNPHLRRIMTNRLKASEYNDYARRKPPGPGYDDFWDDSYKDHAEYWDRYEDHAEKH